MLVVSQFEGRIRIRDEKMKKETLLSRVQEALLETDGVDGVEVNSRVGSLLVFYTAAKTETEKILNIIGELLDSYVCGPASGFSNNESSCCRLDRCSFKLTPAMKRVAANIGMLASLGFSMLAAVLHLKKLHIITGIIFLLLVGDHCLDKKERLFA